MTSNISVQDRFEIFQQMNEHQRRIDNDASRESALRYVDLYWPEAKFTVHDVRHTTFEASRGLKQLYDYAHSVFPIEKWSHDVGPFSIEGSGDRATAQWRWAVRWRRELSGIVSTGLYEDVWERRGGVWKCLERVSTVDPNWPIQLFQPYVDREKELFRES